VAIEKAKVDAEVLGWVGVDVFFDGVGAEIKVEGDLGTGVGPFDGDWVVELDGVDDFVGVGDGIAVGGGL
jgi:hypothetical protein